MNRIKVLFISNEGTLGGAATSLVDMIKALGERIEPYVVMPEGGPLTVRLQEMGTEYSVIHFTMGYGSASSHDKDTDENNFRDNYEAAVSILPIIKERNIQIIHSNTSVSNVGAFASLLASIPHVWHIRELLENYDAEYWEINFKKKLFSCCDKIISISNFVKKKILVDYDIQSVAIYDGIDIARYSAALDGDKGEETGEINELLLVGNIYPTKGQLCAVMAIHELVKEGIKNVHLTLIGNDSISYLLSLKYYMKEHGIEKYISILPFQMNMSKYRKQCGYSLTCSSLEALGRVTLEAMLAGNIVIGANTGGTLEIIGDSQERGYLYEEGSYKDLARAMKKAFSADNTLIRKKAKEYVQENFNLEWYSAKILELYQAVLQDFRLTEEKERMAEQLKLRYEAGQHRSLPSLGNSVVKYKRLCSLFDKWLRIRQSGHSLEEFFIKERLLKIAIYGMGYLGADLFNEILGSVKISYVIDRRKLEFGNMVKTVKPEDDFEEVDAIIITAQDDTGEIKKLLERKCSYRILYLDEIINSFGRDW